MPRKKASATQARNDDDDGENNDDVLEEVDEEPAGRKGKGARRSGVAAAGSLREGVGLANSYLIYGCLIRINRIWKRKHTNYAG
jgi:hypothetical protein